MRRGTLLSHSATNTDALRSVTVMHITNDVRRVRLARGLTLEAVAARAGVAHNTLSQIERGQRHGRPATQRAIAAALDVPGRELFPL